MNYIVFSKVPDHPTNIHRAKNALNTQHNVARNAGNVARQGNVRVNMHSIPTVESAAYGLLFFSFYIRNS